MIVNSASGALVRDPVTKLAIVDGTDVDVDPNDPYWGRLIADGDLVPDHIVAEAQSRASADGATATRIAHLADEITVSSEDAA